MHVGQVTATCSGVQPVAEQGERLYGPATLRTFVQGGGKTARPPPQSCRDTAFCRLCARQPSLPLLLSASLEFFTTMDPPLADLLDLATFT